MKKIYVLASVLLAATTLKAQTTVDFEDLNLLEDSFYNGNDEVGKFISGGVTFNNSYTAEYDVWSGFAFSNMKNDTTSSFTNQYSAFPAIGASNSATYGVNYSGDTLFFPANVNLQSVALTNTTYAYLSMKNGDAFTKQFGSPNGPDGNPDGTDGKDYFYIRIFGYNSNHEVTDSVDFYLADFTSENEEDHYIIDSWTEADLSSFLNVNYLTFQYFSSDVGDWGINTPTYFALDNLVYKESTSGISENKPSSFSVYPNPASSVVNIKGKGDYVVQNMSGQTVLEFQNKGMTNLDISSLKPGMYLIQNNSGTSNTVQKLIVQ